MDTTKHVEGLLDTSSTGPDDQVAIIGFDSRPKVLQQLTSDSGDIATLTGYIDLYFNSLYIE